MDVHMWVDGYLYGVYIYMVIRVLAVSLGLEPRDLGILSSHPAN